MSDQMYTIIVADDEEELREAMCRMIDWEAAGFKLMGSAGNGLDALQMVEQYQPDLLLTDIRMPFINGTELARQVRELQPLIRVAFLSGYDDFEYAQSAIDSQVIAYLLKPITIRQLTEALVEIHQKMEEQFRFLTTGKESSPELSQTVTALLLDDFGEQPPEEDLRRRLTDGGFAADPEDTYFVIAAAREEGQELMPANIARITDQVLGQSYRSSSIVSGARMISLVAARGEPDQQSALLDELYYMLTRVLGSCVIGISAPFDSLGAANRACREAIDAVRMADGAGIQPVRRDMAAAGKVMYTEKESTAAFDRLLFGGNRKELEAFLEGTLGADGAELTAMQLYVTAQGILRSVLEKEELAGLQRQFGLLNPLSTGMDPEQFRRSVAAFCLAGSERISDRKKDGMKLLVEQTLHIIEREYMDESLTLNSVSERLHVSPNYLSANMKKYADDTFIKLLIKRRMEAAQALIRAGNLRIAEVAWRCGYSDQHYFSYCFKKYFGISPAKMRQGEGEK